MTLIRPYNINDVTVACVRSRTKLGDDDFAAAVNPHGNDHFSECVFVGVGMETGMNGYGLSDES